MYYLPKYFKKKKNYFFDYKKYSIYSFHKRDLIRNLYTKLNSFFLLKKFYFILPVFFKIFSNNVIKLINYNKNYFVNSCANFLNYCFKKTGKWTRNLKLYFFRSLLYLKYKKSLLFYKIFFNMGLSFKNLNEKLKILSENVDSVHNCGVFFQLKYYKTFANKIFRFYKNTIITNSIFLFVGMVQIINYNITFKQYSLEVYNGFKVDLLLLFFTTFFLTKFNFIRLNKFSWFLFKHYKNILYRLKNKIKELITKLFTRFHANVIKRKKFFYKHKLHHKRAKTYLSYYSNQILSSYIGEFSNFFLTSFTNTYNLFSWKNINDYNIINNYKLFKYLKLKRFNKNLIKILYLYNNIILKKLFNKFFVLVLKLKHFNNKFYLYFYVHKFIIFILTNYLCRNLIN